MPIPEYSWSLDLILNQKRLFPNEFEEDLWLMFHGTSGFNIEAIERDGFSVSKLPVSPQNLGRVVAIFDRLKWAGRDQGGYPILKPFSLDYDFKNGRSPLFFAEDSLRALTHAARDFAGGEKVRSLRRAISDLDAYLNDSNIRDTHSRAKESEIKLLTELDADPSMIETARLPEIDLEWLRHEIGTIRSLRDIAESAWGRHDFGVVYALAMSEDDLEGLSWKSAMGIESVRDIPSSKIVGRVRVPGDFHSEYIAADPKMKMAKINSGLLRAISVG